MDRLNATAANLNAHGFSAQVFDTGADAKQAALAIIGDRSVGFGGSITVNELGIYETVTKKGNKAFWHWKADEATPAPAMLAGAQAADVYICSANAIIETGSLLNIDGTGNRVANLFYGPKTVIVIAGENKLAPNYDEALARIKREACPSNGKRLNMKTPCTATGVCTDCDSPQRMCRVTVLLERPTFAVPEVHVLLVRESLGY
ncbi:lactate utilization protein [Eubacteriales bacterium OttesenSCG-928-K08]|nr:lactate utilization protein [Eubacteriales bacterium OttesenSCG-928-K08]